MNTPIFDPTKYTKSRWLKGADLPKRLVPVTIAKVYEHHFEATGETKPVIDLEEIEQSMPLNKTQVVTLIELFGTDIRLWVGQRIQLQAIPSNYAGKPTILISQVNEPEPPGKVPGYSREDAARDMTRRQQPAAPDWATAAPGDAR